MAYRHMHEVEIKHEGLHKYRVIRGADRYVVEQKAQAQVNQWDEMWEKKLAKEVEQAEKKKQAQEKEEKKALAVQQTNEAQEKLQELEDTLIYTLDLDDAIDWESLKDNSEYEIAEPKQPEIINPEDKPLYSDSQYQPTLNFFYRIIPSLKKKKEVEIREKFEKDIENWEKDKEQKEIQNKKNQEEYNLKLDKWKNEKKEYENQQAERNHAIDNQKSNYLNKQPTAIIDYCDMVLSHSHYPDVFPQEFDIEYNPETKILIVDYSLPAPEDIPTLKQVKYVQSRDEFDEKYLSVADEKKLYDGLLYKITLRSLHELYEADVVDAIESIVFNGWVHSIDKATGQEVDACILSIQANKEEFLNINLAQVDPKMCFKKLKGVGSSKLHSLSPIAPIIKIDRDDPRFVSSYDVADGVDGNENIASMDWQDFENLIRELFEKEFNQGGGEVRITQASRDGGVDAIAFDPDPVRGGKIVIQAKRYTNVVGVSAVRDLYGTVLNEGANKGILVSTADYGSDAYNFAKDKPLTLLNGSNLLHMLEKHGHKAKIDLKGAKKELKEKEM